MFPGPGPGNPDQGSLEPLSVARTPAPGGAPAPSGVYFPRGTPTPCLQTQGEGRKPQRSPARPPRHPPGPGRAAPSRPLAEPGAGAGPGSGLGLLRPLPAPGGALRRLRGYRSCGALSGTAAASGVHRTTFLSPAKCVGAARTWRASAGAGLRKGRGGQGTRGGARAPEPKEGPTGGAETKEGWGVA